MLDVIKGTFKSSFRSARLKIMPYLTHDVAPGSKITPCNKIDKQLVVYLISGNVMTSITALRT